mgnify:CR=1 FL=1
MAKEIERKFIVKDEFKSQAFSSSHIIQGYICRESGRTVRVRIRDEKGYLTIKGPSDKKGISRYEFETEISYEDAEQLIKLCPGGTINKRRYLVKSGIHLFEIDEFYEKNTGLIMAEVELHNENETFIKPPFIGKEVTGDKRFYNSCLLKNPYAKWGKDFEREP